MPDKPLEEMVDSGEFAGYGTRNLLKEDGPADAQDSQETPQNADQQQGKEEPTSLLEAAKKEDEAAKQEETKPKGDGEIETEEEKKAAEQVKKDPLDEAITDFTNVDLGLKDFEVDEATVAAFGETAIRIGLTGRQAKELAQFQLKAIKDARESLTAASMKNLKKEWGKDADDNLQRVNNFVIRINEMVGNNEFVDALEKSGVGCYDSFAKGLLAILDLVSEDSLGSIPKTGGSGQETALDAIAAAFANAKG